jgi:Ca-activated chloride channel family protein
VRGRALVLLLALGAVAIAFARSRADDSGDAGGTRPSARAAGPAALRIAFAYSPEKAQLIRALVARFNAQHHTLGGRTVVIEARNVASGAAETGIAQGRLKPVAWSPASSLWARLLNFEADKRLAPAENASIVRTPLVIAMWEPMARALGWPKARLGFADLLRLARAPGGWAAVGHPEFGRFKLVHTNPDFSTSGLAAVMAEYYAVTGKVDGLTERDVRASTARRTIRDLERSIVHYGPTTPFVAQQMHREGPGYASAAAMEEVTLRLFNRERGSRDRLVALYPKEGTFFSDNPYIVLSAPWVSPQEARAARLFERFALSQVTPKAAAAYDFRPGGGQLPSASGARGADVAVDLRQPQQVLALPEPRVLATIRRAWRVDRKPARILLVVDTSTSMSAEGRLDHAKAGLRAFLRQVSPQDSVGLTAFSDHVRSLAPIRSIRSNGRELGRLVNGLVPDGATVLYDATAAGVRQVEAGARADHINAVVVLTDGQDATSTLRAQDVIDRLKLHSESDRRVRVFTIAYSSEASQEQLRAIARASGGDASTGTTANIVSVYERIGSFF